MKNVEILKLVRSEISAIKKRDGLLPPRAYLAVEVAERLRTVKTWEGRDPAHTHIYAVRLIVEEVLNAMHLGLVTHEQVQEPADDYACAWEDSLDHLTRGRTKLKLHSRAS